MTDKYIIDGVNVADCEFYNADDETCREENSKYPIDICEFTKCEGCNCYYKQLQRKEQECERLNKYLHQNFEEKDKLHLIIDRLLEASGYDTTTASAENFEDVYENMRYEKQQIDQLKVENVRLTDELNKLKVELKDMTIRKIDYLKESLIYKQALAEIKELVYELTNEEYTDFIEGKQKQILQLISEVEL